MVRSDVWSIVVQRQETLWCRQRYRAGIEPVAGRVAGSQDQFAGMAEVD
jgi:hypothetical protein